MTRARGTQGVRFDDELCDFLYAFAGEDSPQKDTLELLNDLTVEFIAQTTAEAARVARTFGSGSLRITPEVLLFLARDDPIKYERIKELMESYDTIRKLRVGNAKELAGISKKADKTAIKAEKARAQEAKKQQAKAANKDRRVRFKDDSGGDDGAKKKPAKAARTSTASKPSPVAASSSSASAANAQPAAAERKTEFLM